MNEEKINRKKPGSVRLHCLKGNTAVCLLYKVEELWGYCIQLIKWDYVIQIKHRGRFMYVVASRRQV